MSPENPFGQIARIFAFALAFASCLATAAPVTPDPTFQTGTGPNNTVYSIEEGPSGTLWIAGSFSSVDGQPRNSIAKLSPDGALDPGFVPPSQLNTIYLLAPLPGGKVLAGGNYLGNFSSRYTYGILRLDAAGAPDPGFDASVTVGNGYVSSILTLADGKILIGGNFPSGVARLLADGSRDTTFDAGAGPPPGSSISSLRLQPSGKILAGGSFDSFSGLPRANLCRLNADGSPDPTFGTADSGPDGTVLDIALQADGRLLIGGTFSTLGGQLQPNLARLGADGVLDPDFRPTVTSAIHSIAALADGRMLAGGEFSRVNGIERKYFALLHADGSPDATFDTSTGANYIVYRLLLQPGGKILAAGSFATIGGVPAKYLARLAAPSSQTRAVAASVSPSIAEAGTVLRLTGSNFFNLTGIGFPGGAAAAFTVISETELDVTVPANAVTGRLVLKSPYGDSSAATPFYALPGVPGQSDPLFDVGSGANGPVYGLARDASGRVLALGNFSTIGPSKRSEIARLLADGTVDPNFLPPTGSNSLRALVIQPDGKILTGGYLVGSGGPALARLNPDGSPDPGFASALGSYVYALDVQPDGKILAGGSFSRRIARLTSSGATDTTFDPGSGASSTVNVVHLLPDGRILVAGNFSSFNGVRSKAIIRLLPNGMPDPTFGVTGSGVSGDVDALAVQPDGSIVIGGSFYSVNGNNALKYLARLGPDGAVDTAFAPAPNAAVAAIEIAADGRIAIGGDFTAIAGSARDRVALLHADGAVVAGFNTLGGPSGTVSALLPEADGGLYIGGSFGNLGGIPPAYIARLYGDGGATRPAISSIGPALAAAGEIVTISGSNLALLTSAEFAGGVAASIQPVSETSVRVVVPAGAMSGPIVLKNAYGQGSSRTIFRLRASLLPVLDPLPPGTVSPGQIVTITGRNFFDVTQVRIGVVAAAFTVVSATEMTFTVPENAVTARVNLTSPGGMATSTADLAVTKAPPVLTSAATASGTVGVNFRFTLAATKSPTGFSAAPLPAGLALDPASGVISGIPTAAGSFTIAISATNFGGTASGSLAITIALPPPPVVASVTPEFVAPGGKFLISGSYLTLTTGVTVGGVSADFTLLSDGKIRVTLPAGASGIVEITTTQGTATGTRPVALWDFQDGAQITGIGSNAAGERDAPAGLTDAIAISAGGYHSLALRAGGGVIGWGGNWAGQATPPADLAPATAISAGGFHSLALQADGTIAAWGRDDEGQCSGAAGLKKIAAIAAGSYHSLVLRRNGTVAAFGSNAIGQTSVPQSLGGVIAIAAGGDFSLALKSDGTIAAWGDNSFGQTNVPAAAAGIVAISAGRTHAVALKSDGTVVCWGADWAGQSAQPAGLSGVVEISAGADHTTARRADGTLAAWGADWSGQATIPAGIADASAISSDGDHTLVLRSAAPAQSPALLVTGAPGQPLVFNPSVTNGPFQFSAENLPAGLAIDAATGAISGTPARGGDSLVTLVARNSNGISRQPIRFFPGPYILGWGEGLPGPIPQNLGIVVKVAAGPAHCLALREDGTVAAWGRGYNGETSVPAGLTGVIDIAAGQYFSLALKSDGTVVGWGFLRDGQVPTVRPNTVATGIVSISARDGAGIGLTSAGRVEIIVASSYGFGARYGSGLTAAVTPGETFFSADRFAGLDRGGFLTGYKTSGEVSTAGFSTLAASSPPLRSTSSDFTVWAIRPDGALYEMQPDSRYATTVILRPETRQAVAAAGGDQFALIRNADGSAVALAQTSNPNDYYTRTVPPAPFPAGDSLVDVTAIAAQARYAIAVKSPAAVPDIVSLRVLSARRGQPFSHQLAAAGPPVAWSAPLLPAGLSLNAATGQISGSPTVTGIANFLVIARRSGSMQTQVISLKTTSGFAPVDLTLSAASLAEDLPAGSPVGTLAAVDFTSGDTFSYALAAGPGSANNGFFKISGSQLQTSAPLDFESLPLASVRIRVTDSGGNDFEKVFQIHIGDVATDDDDKDGLTQADEFALGTDPRLRDTDGDGASDGQEIAAASDPLSAASRPARYIACWGSNTFGQCEVPNDLGPVIALAAGDYFTLALQSDGTVAAWGSNTSGQCDIPPDLYGVVAVAASSNTSFALRSDGTVAAWGANFSDIISTASALTGVIEISARANQLVALRTDGSVMVLGYDSYNIFDIPPAAAGSVRIAAGDGYVLAINRDGGTVGWGEDYLEKSSGPGLYENIVDIAASGYGSLALDTAGKVRFWGGNISDAGAALRELGPATVIAAGNFNGLALNSAGRVVVWGSNTYGQRNVPAGLGPVRAIAGAYHVSALVSEEPLGRFATASIDAIAGLPFVRQLAWSGNTADFRADFLPPGIAFDAGTATLTGTPQSSGIFNIRVTAENGFQHVSQIVQLRIEATRRFEEWAAVHFPTAGPRGNPLADPDSDGVPNLLEYALHRDPLAADSTPAAVGSTISTGGTAHLALTYERLTDAPDLQFTVEVSGDLTHWQSATTAVSVVPYGDTETVTVRDNAPVSPGPRFMRLRVANRIGSGAD